MIAGSENIADYAFVVTMDVFILREFRGFPVTLRRCASSYWLGRTTEKREHYRKQAVLPGTLRRPAELTYEDKRPT
jgi:hypothetical protein